MRYPLHGDRLGGSGTYVIIGLNYVKMSGSATDSYWSPSGYSNPGKQGSVASNGNITLSGSSYMDGEARPGVGMTLSGAVGGQIWCRFVSGASLSIAGDLHVQSEIANGGLTCQTLGNKAGAPTVLEVGSDHSLLSMLAASRPDL